MSPHFVLSLALTCLLLGGSPSRADDARPQGRAERERLERLVATLGHQTWARREAGTRQLLAMGPRIVPFLRDARRRADCPLEVRRRLEKIGLRLTVRADAHSAGLGGQLVCDGATLATGQKRTLTMRLLNHRAAPLILGRMAGKAPLTDWADHVRFHWAGRERPVSRWSWLSSSVWAYAKEATQLDAGQLRTVTYVLSAHPVNRRGHVELRLRGPSIAGPVTRKLVVPEGKLSISYCLAIPAKKGSTRLNRIGGNWTGRLERTVTLTVWSER